MGQSTSALPDECDNNLQDILAMRAPAANRTITIFGEQHITDPAALMSPTQYANLIGTVLKSTSGLTVYFEDLDVAQQFGDRSACIDCDTRSVQPIRFFISDLGAARYNEPVNEYARKVWLRLMDRCAHYVTDPGTPDVAPGIAQDSADLAEYTTQIVANPEATALTPIPDVFIERLRLTKRTLHAHLSRPELRRLNQRLRNNIAQLGAKYAKVNYVYLISSAWLFDIVAFARMLEAPRDTPAHALIICGATHSGPIFDMLKTYGPMVDAETVEYKKLAEDPAACLNIRPYLQQMRAWLGSRQVDLLDASASSRSELGSRQVDLLESSVKDGGRYV